MLFPLNSVNQSAPSGPEVMAHGSDPRRRNGELGGRRRS